MINVTKTFLPPFEEYTAILKRAWDKGWITNNGELLQELEVKLKAYLQVPHLLVCSNGTIVLQMALKALNITKEVITTPFSYVATTNAILWEGCTPVFADIDPLGFCIDPNKIEALITPDTQAILATHVYGIPCEVESIDAIAKRYDLKVIYDGAHAFGCTYNGKSLLNYGDISTCSFHATKIFHTIEGGCVICNDNALFDKLYKYRSFGHLGEEYFSIGINAKNSEAHAAMGLAMLPKMSGVIAERQHLFENYRELLQNTGLGTLQTWSIPGLEWNYGYFPIFFETAEQQLQVRNALEAQQIFSRRYFYPSLNNLPFFESYQPCPISEKVADTVLCLPLYNGLSIVDQQKIAQIINASLLLPGSE